MIGDLMKEAPHVWNMIRDFMKNIVSETERKHNATPGTYWYRFFRPDDNGIGGTAKQYYATLTTVTEEHLLAATSQITVPTGEALASFGWICTYDLGKAGYLKVKVEGVEKDLLAARFVYRQQDPAHYYIDFDKIFVGHENAKLDYVIYNGMGHDLSAIVIPILFRVAPRPALNLDQIIL